MARRLRPKRWVVRFFQFLLMAFLVLVPLGVGAGYVVVKRLSADLPDVSALETQEIPQTSRIFSKDGQVVATLFVENRTTVKLDRLSPFLPKALLAVEDSRFYKHHGVDWIGVGRTLVANVVYRGIDQGASTLTMQLARTRFLTQDRTLARKIRETILATRIENKYSKDQILEFYLNSVYFGSGAYGVAAASSLYFQKPASQLSLAQSALIAGLVQAPSSLSPLVDAPASLERMQTVLSRMKTTGTISQAQYDQALAESKTFRFQAGAVPGDQLLKAPYFTTYVIAELSKRYSEDELYRSGLQVRTTLDMGLQKAAEEELAATLAELGPAQYASNGALVLIENKTGFIRAMVGGVKWSQDNQFNRAWQSVRQPGSSFKAFVYAAALLSGMTPDSEVEDSPVTYGDWSPKNSDGKFKGKMTMGQALQESRNPVAVRLCEKVTPERVVEVAHALGIKEELKPHLALALGACEVSPLSMASAYSTLASGGMYHEPLAVTQISSAQGEVLTDNRSPEGKRILPEEVAHQMTEMLLRVVLYGTGSAADVAGLDIAGKTGTTDDSRDAWFVGYSPEYTMAVWVGNDDHSTMDAVYGGGIPAIIWNRVMSRCVAQHEVSRFKLTQTSKVKICQESGFLAGPGCPKSREMRMRPRLSPCPLHATASPSPTPTFTPTPPPIEESPTPSPTFTPVPPEPTATPEPLL